MSKATVLDLTKEITVDVLEVGEQSKSAFLFCFLHNRARLWNIKLASIEVNRTISKGG